MLMLQMKDANGRNLASFGYPLAHPDGGAASAETPPRGDENWHFIRNGQTLSAALSPDRAALGFRRRNPRYEHVRTSFLAGYCGLFKSMGAQGGCQMQSLPALLERFPTRELEIRRLGARDEEFRCACEDYEVAAEALRHWECVKENADRTAEYHRIADEIAAEIVAHLDAASV